MFLRNLSFPLLVGILAFSLSGSLLAAPPKGGAGRNETICCETTDGKTACGDTTPQQCSGRPLRVYDRSGNLVRRIAAPMTWEERQAAADAARKEKEEERLKREELRLDRALLATYSSVEEIDKMQKYTEDSVNTEINNILARIGASQQKKKDLDQEAAFYSAQNMPRELAKAVLDEEMELKTQNDLLNVKREELAQIRKRFANARERYIKLTSGQNKP